MSKFVEETFIDICEVANRNGSLTKTVINNNRGKYPVYTASVGKATGYINSYINTQSSIIIPTAGNGSAGKPYVVNDKFYTIGANAVGFIPKHNVDIFFVYYQLKNKLLSLVKGESFKNINQKLIENIKITMPVTDEGLYDLDEQQRLVFIYKDIENKKKKLLKRISELEDLMIHIDNEEYLKFKDVSLNELFDPQIGDSKYTKSYCNSNEGIYPLYSANTETEFANINSYDYDGEFITWTKDGLAGYLMILKNKFSITSHRGILIPKKELKGINLNYIKYILEPIFRRNKKGREGELGKNEYTTLNTVMIKKLNIHVPIPINLDGTYDLEKQKEIANMYRQIDEIKQGLIEKIKSLVEIKIVPSE